MAFCFFQVVKLQPVESNAFCFAGMSSGASYKGMLVGFVSFIKLDS